MDDYELILNAPNKRSIRCINCKKGRFDYMAKHCQAFDSKPNEVYFGDGECPFFEPIVK